MSDVASRANARQLQRLLRAQGLPQRGGGEAVALGAGAGPVVLLFLCTVIMTAAFHSVFHLPPVLGMMTGAPAGAVALFSGLSAWGVAALLLHRGHVLLQRLPAAARARHDDRCTRVAHRRCCGKPWHFLFPPGLKGLCRRSSLRRSLRLGSYSFVSGDLWL